MSRFPALAGCLTLIVAQLAAAPASAASADDIEPIVANAAFPTNLAPAPDGSLYYTERETGRVREVGPDGTLRPELVAEVPVVTGGERGLLGIAIDPAWPERRRLYLALTDAADERNLIVRIDLDRSRSPEVLFEGLSSVSGYHNGGDLAFGPDGMLYAVTGEAHDPDLAQDPDSPGGKLLRLTPDGAVPDDNPSAGSPVYATGIRNSFGVCVDPRTGQVWETENGPDRWDEVNRVEPGDNLGWPEHLGPGGAPEFVDPVLAFDEVIVPTGCAVTGAGDVYFGDFAGRLHHVAGSNGRARDEIVATFAAPITDVAAAPDGDLLVATVESIDRLELRAQAPPGSGTPADPGGPATEPAAPAPAEDGPLPRVWIVAGAIAAIAIALGVRSRRGRR